MHVQAENSIVGHCKFEGVSAKIINCNFTGRRYPETLLIINDSTVTFEKISLSSSVDFTFKIFDIMRNSSVTIKDSDFVHNEIDTLIDVRGNCKLIVETCRFIGNIANTSIISLIHSSVRIENSLFEMTVGTVVEMRETVSEILNSFFSRNNVGSWKFRNILLGSDNTHISVNNSSFAENNGAIGGAIHISYWSVLNITNSYFSKNLAKGVGGAISGISNSWLVYHIRFLSQTK